jgi:uncharacterized protein YndB with AHSA1/START domain
MSSTDRIEKRVTLKAPRTRVWKAISDSREFGEWFHASFEGPFVAGTRVSGVMTEAGYEGEPFIAWVERIEPEHHFSFRWHPYAIEKGADYSNEPTTLVTFELEERGGETVLTIVESGFDALPASRRAKAFESNSEGWAIQSERVARHVESR